ncbi:MAG: hypothetical protein RLZZ272_544 [Actinomycetota bacterium]|jgi:1-acyl-sn-glycerol-3-phosphate acyltransferase
MGALYSFGSGVVEYGIRALGVDWRVDGLEHLPATGPAIVASNHLSYLDFAFVMLSPPRPRREMRFLARADLFDGRFLGWFLRGVGQVPVDAHRDPLAALRHARACLDAGELVGIHPEGTISPSFVPRERAATGAVRLAEDADVPLVPCAVWGAQRLLTKWRPARLPPRGITVRVRYGEPWRPTGGSPLERTAELMRRISELLAALQAEDALEPGAWWVPAHLGGSAPTPQEAEARLARQRAERRARALGEDGPGSHRSG